MKKFARNTRSAIGAFAAKARNLAAPVIVGTTSLLASGMVRAGELSTGFESGVDKTELMEIGVAVMVVVGIVFLITSGKRTGRG